MFCYEYRDRCLLRSPESSHGAVDSCWRWESGWQIPVNFGYDIGLPRLTLALSCSCSLPLLHSHSLTLPYLAFFRPHSRSLHLRYQYQSCSHLHGVSKVSIVLTPRTLSADVNCSLIQHLKCQRCPLPLHYRTYTSPSTLLAMGRLGLFGRSDRNRMVP